jgi:hypothetical protein
VEFLAEFLNEGSGARGIVLCDVFGDGVEIILDEAGKLDPRHLPCPAHRPSPGISAPGD